LLVSLVITTIASTLTSIWLNGHTIQFFYLPLTIGFFAATTATAIIVGSMATTASADTGEATQVTASADGPRETGTVKWFNVSKGFGFIIKEDGEEIFVHFRSIRGEGRRSLRDGQKVSFVVAESEKGPQAEDVVGEN
jgi:CspA family cold shock protein